VVAKATTTIRQVLSYQPHQTAWFAATQTLFNHVGAFYFEVIQAHERVLDLNNKDALTALEMLTHRTQKNPTPLMPLEESRADLPAMFRRAAINAALGSARSFFSHLLKWRKRKEKAMAKGKTFTERPPVPPRAWNKSVPFYVGQWKERTPSSILLKVWTGTCWSWLKLRITGRELPTDAELGSPQLVRRGKQWWLHTPIEKHFARPANSERQVTTNPQTTMCAVDLNLDNHLAVCTIQTVEGTILATKFIGGGQAINGFRKHQLGRIARNRRKTGIIAENEQDNADLWRKIKHSDESLAHLVSARIVQFAHYHGASILVFEHLGTLKPQKGRYSRRGNSKRAFWMKGRIFIYAKYKAWNQGIITSRVSPWNTSRQCARCQSLVARYAQGQLAEGYTSGAPLVLCPECSMRGNADRNASLNIGQRLLARYHKQAVQEKPPPPLLAKTGDQSAALPPERASKDTGVVVCQEVKSAEGPSIPSTRHADANEHGTAQGGSLRMEKRSSDIPCQLRLFTE
jgi:putative transposase